MIGKNLYSMILRKNRFVLFLIVATCIITGCDTLLGWGEKPGFSYTKLNFLSSTYTGGFKVYYQKYENGSAFLGLNYKTSGIWVTEDEEFKKYSYQEGWYRWHIKKITNSYIEIGTRKD